MEDGGRRMTALLSVFPALCFGVPPGEVIPPTMFGANTMSSEAGWAIAMYADDEGGRRSELATLLRECGLSAVRLPGGTCANFYFWDSEPRTREAARVVGMANWSTHPANHMYSYFVPFDQCATFCEEAGIRLIWQLNTATIYDDEGLHLLAVSPKGNDLLPAADYDDGDRLAAATDSVRRLARHIREAGLPVPDFELGNEEYGYPALDPLRYAEIVRAYIDALREELPGCTVLVTLGDNQIVGDAAMRGWAEALLDDLAAHGYADKVDYFTMHYSWRSVCEDAARLLDEHGFGGSRLAVTEFTCGWPDYWDKTPRYRHAVQVAEFICDLLADPRVDIVCIHDLLSQNFGVFHYNQRSFEPPDDRSYDGSLGYVAMPTAQAYALMRPLAGATLLSASGAMVEAARDGRYLAVLTNTGEATRECVLDPAAHGLACGAARLALLTGDSPEATEAHVAEHQLAPADGKLTVSLPPLSVARVEVLGP
jgi:hypothetical protein